MTFNAYRVNEIFHSIQGEGYHTGTPATFIRLQGCPVGCEWCDTKYTWGAGGERMTGNTIVEKCIEQHVVITGGEPLMKDLDDILVDLHKRRHYTQIETSGYCDYKGELRPRWLTWSPKPNLNFKANEYLYRSIREVKFVVTPDLPTQVVLDTWLDFRKRDMAPYIILMPEGCPPGADQIMRAMTILKECYHITCNPKFWGLWRVMDRLQWRFNVK